MTKHQRNGNRFWAYLPLHHRHRTAQVLVEETPDQMFELDKVMGLYYCKIDMLQRGLADAKVGIANIFEMVDFGVQRDDVLSGELAVRGHTLSQLDDVPEAPNKGNPEPDVTVRMDDHCYGSRIGQAASITRREDEFFQMLTLRVTIGGQAGGLPDQVWYIPNDAGADMDDSSFYAYQ
ncbi:hypothetical protein BV898_08638 [Hypsibius exemplaris]|uniref:Uncharacterized protein n=1 Tax=Hypsibius exemplaris TaxID=2072580 RepID=A0A1W0WPV5_HYPEX|nr:hypothetical protein BV898_08638 [Hypsibius exemplaris]